MKSALIIHFTNPDVRTQPQPWPVQVRGNNVVASGLGPDDGATLIGFGPLGRQTITQLPDAVREDPSLAVGLAPSFSNGDGFFEWACLVSEVETREAGRE